MILTYKDLRDVVAQCKQSRSGNGIRRIFSDIFHTKSKKDELSQFDVSQDDVSQYVEIDLAEESDSDVLPLDVLEKVIQLIDKHPKVASADEMKKQLFECRVLTELRSQCVEMKKQYIERDHASHLRKGAERTRAITHSAPVAIPSRTRSYEYVAPVHAMSMPERTLDEFTLFEMDDVDETPTACPVQK